MSMCQITRLLYSEKQNAASARLADGDDSTQNGTGETPVLTEKRKLLEVAPPRQICAIMECPHLITAIAAVAGRPPYLHATAACRGNSALHALRHTRPQAISA